MKPWRPALIDSLQTGQLVAVGTALAATICGSIEQGNAVAPLNAISHIAFGDEAFDATGVSIRHTATGLVLNHAAGISWAVLYELLFGDAADAGNVPVALVGGVAIAGLAYVTDYHIVPRRLTPGFERHVSARAVLCIYVVLALGLVAASVRPRE